MISSVYIRFLLAIIVVAVIIGIVTVVIRSDPHGSAPVKPDNQQLPNNIDVVLKKARFSEIQNGQVLWELIAERVNYDKAGDTAYLSAIRMEFQRTSSRGTITVTADTGHYSNLTKNVSLQGNVHVVTEDGARFETGSIVYTGASEHFSTADPVTFSQQRLQLKAVGMDLSVKNQQARFHSAIAASIGMK